MEALNPEIKSEQVQQPELLEPNGSGAALAAAAATTAECKDGVGPRPVLGGLC